MTNTEKLLLLLVMSMCMLFSIYDIVTLYNAVCWELGAECAVLTVSVVTMYLTATEKL